MRPCRDKSLSGNFQCTGDGNVMVEMNNHLFCYCPSCWVRVRGILDSLGVSSAFATGWRSVSEEEATVIEIMQS